MFCEILLTFYQIFLKRSVLLYSMSFQMELLLFSSSRKGAKRGPRGALSICSGKYWFQVCAPVIQFSMKTVYCSSLFLKSFTKLLLSDNISQVLSDRYLSLTKVLEWILVWWSAVPGTVAICQYVRLAWLGLNCSTI